MVKTKKIKGGIYFYYNNGELNNYIIPKNENNELFFRDRNIYDLIDGKDFANCVRDGSFIDYDGSLSTIFVDGYESNLGIFAEEDHAYFHKGQFMVDLYTFEQLCEKHKVKVNWANK